MGTHRRNVAIILAIAITAIAGCTGPGPQESDSGASDEDMLPDVPEATSVPITTTDCDILEVFVGIDAEEVQDSGVIPDHFTVAVIGSEVLAVMGVNRCQMDNGTMERFFFAFQVEPTDASLDPGDGINVFYEPEHIVLNGTTFAALVAEHRANATVADAMTSNIGLLDSTATATLATGQHSLDAVQVDGTSDAGRGFGTFREYFPADNGYGFFEATYGADTGSYGGGTGTITTAPDTVARQLLDEERAGAAITAAGTVLLDAAIGFIPSPT